MNIKRLAIILLIAASTVMFSQQPHPEIVSLVQLIASPDRYDGKLVNVKGFLRLEPEGNILYLSSEDYQNGLEENGIWVDVNKDIFKQKEDVDQKYVQVLATFSSKRVNYLSAGRLTKVQKLTLWSDPNHPRAIAGR